MIIRNIALLGIAFFAASCTMPRDFHPQYRQSSAASIIPLVCIPNAPTIPFVNASVNGRQGLFVVDTGTSITCIDTSFAKALGLETRPLGGWRVHSNVSGELKIAWVDTLTVGNDVFEKFAVVVIGLTHMTQVLGHQIDGIIGLNVLSATGCQIDPQRGRLSLHPYGPVDHPVPIILEGEAMFMNAQINGRMIRMKVDTGANFTSLNSAEWFRLATSGVASTNIQTIVDANRFTTNSVHRELRLECRLGDVIQKDFPILDIGIDDNLLGMDFFQHYIVTFDFKAGKAYFEDRAANQASEVTARKLAEPQR